MFHTDVPDCFFNYIFGAVWFICLSSTVAFIVSGVVNSLVNAAIGKLFKGKTTIIEFFTRSALSTFLGQALDNFIFIAGVYVVFAPIFWGTEPLPILTCCGTAILGGLMELICELIFTPLGYKIVKNWEKNNVGEEYLKLHNMI